MDLLSGLGIRAERRMTPRIGIALAGAGALIAIVGAIGIGGDNLTTDDGDLNRIPGVLVSIALIAVGMAVLLRIRSGPLATGASVGAAIGIPALLVFATVKDTYPFFGFDLTLLVATVAWLAAYLVGPARGRMLFLALALVGAPIFVLEQVEDISSVPEEIGSLFGQAMLGGIEGQAFDEESFSEEDFAELDDEDFAEFEDELDEQLGDDFEEPDLPSPNTVGAILLAFGIGYAIASQRLSRRGLDGVATPFAPLSVVLVLFGVSFLGGELEAIGTGIALVVLGLALTFVGATAARRFTTWAGAAVVANGVIVLVGEALGDGTSTTVAFTVFLLTGLAMIFAAHLLMDGIGENAEEDERRSLRPDAPRAGREPGPPQADEVWAPPTSS